MLQTVIGKVGEEGGVHAQISLNEGKVNDYSSCKQ